MLIFFMFSHLAINREDEELTGSEDPIILHSYVSSLPANDAYKEGIIIATLTFYCYLIYFSFLFFRLFIHCRFVVAYFIHWLTVYLFCLSFCVCIFIYSRTCFFSLTHNSSVIVTNKMFLCTL